MNATRFGSVLFVLALSGPGCSRDAPAPARNDQKASAPAVAPLAAPSASASTSTAVQTAAVGQPAPEFTLPDLDGHEVSLARLRGKYVVLEWFNPECPFVNASHLKGSLKNTAAEQTAQGVVWLAINSAAPGKQGHGAEATTAGKMRFGLTHPILLDESGTVGHAYGAKRTPHLFVIDPAGVLRYAGAVDNSPDGEGESPKDGKLVNYVKQALDDLRAGRPVQTPTSEAYGCSVKYGT